MVVLVVTATTATAPTVSARAPSGEVVLSRADAIADIDALFVALERIHPNPYFARSRELVSADRRQITEALPDSLTRNELWSRLASLVASLGDGHTEVPPPIAFLATLAAMYRDGNRPPEAVKPLERIRVFPAASVLVDADRHLIVTAPTLAEGISRGDRVLRINDQDADRLVADLMRETSGDSDAHRAIALVANLTDLLSVHSVVAPYRLTVAGADGQEHTVSTDGATMQSVIDGRRGRPSGFVYRSLDADIGYMELYSLAGDWSDFKKDLGAMFRRLADEEATTVIIDIRRNGGGYTEFADELLRYLTRTPYRSWSRQELKRSKELRDSVDIVAPVRWPPFKYFFPDPRRIFTGAPGTTAIWMHPDVKTPRRAEPFFNGAVCVLTGPATFSAAAIFADTIKTFHLATIIGEETGGRANTTMQPVVYQLPRSALVVSIATGRSIRANGDDGDLNTVAPDIIVRTTADDIRNGRDPVLERARACPRLQREASYATIAGFVG
jgi:C-terminal processing protease CtpA/Prc